MRHQQGESVAGSSLGLIPIADDILIKSVYSTLFLGYLKPGKFHIKSKMRTGVDAHSVILLWRVPDVREHIREVDISIAREASALSIRLYRAVPGPQIAGWADQ